MKARLRVAPGGAIGVAGVLALAGISLVVGCSDSSGSPTKIDVRFPSDGGADTQEGGSPDAQPVMACRPSPRASEDLSGRVDLSVMTAGQSFVKTSDLFTRFNSICGGCHVSASNGGFQVNAQTFATVFDASRLARIESNDPTFAMPPVGRAFSSRGPEDPVRILATYLEAWLAQGRPVDMFVMPASAGADLGSYAYTTMTNLGDCVPSSAMYQSSASDEMTAKDKFFMNATALPGNLADTDLTTFDTAALAANGVIAYRPTYALWSAGSGKLRFIRVPKGTSIAFHKDTQTFDIPPYTRFYKTFFRKVIDKSGKVRNRKMETRLIVSLPDGVDTDGVTPLPKALYGTYLWSDDESSATLWTNPYRDGLSTGFSDLTATYIADEIALQDIVDNLPTGAGSLAEKLEVALNDPSNVGVRQHYAVPGSQRCVQCHRGSPTKDFVLGFYPLQVAQRDPGTGGTYDPAEPDEINQLQRFIDYGLITGMASPAEVTPLELSQLPRLPRTPQELNAQAYMIGNCAHCHNPRGYPSLAKPVLATVLNFLPFPRSDKTAEAGIFQFELETMSPVRSRGANQDVPVPYITPSLRDYPVADDNLDRLDNGVNLAPTDSSSGIVRELTWSPKYDVTLEGSLWAPGCRGVTSSDPISDAYCRGRRTGHSFVAAPWRSLVYRNVDTPFPYFDDYVPFPHMPMNTAGFDCRAPRIMGDWMVSIPAVLKPQYQGLSEDVIPHNKDPKTGAYPHDYIDAPQPYQEVKPGDTRFPAAQAAAEARLAEYHGGIRYNYCQDVLGNDIVDMLNPARFVKYNDPAKDAVIVYYPIPTKYLPGGTPPFDPLKPGYYVQPAMGIPYHAEWFDYDPTDASPWAPRRSNWPSVLERGIPDPSLPAGQATLDPATVEARQRLTDVLQTVNLTDDLRKYATTPVPYGLWQNKPGCAAKFAKALATPDSNVKKVSDFTGNNRPAWMDKITPAPKPDDLVYMMAPGESLYRHICINCHGPKADGHGLQSDALAASSEGYARPANFAAGLFGPLDHPGANMVGAFDPATSNKAVAEKWASRYLPWMTLGGTLQLIPQDVINQVQATTILGERRLNLNKLPPVETASANMLNLAKGLCAEVLPDLTDSTVSAYFEPGQWGTGLPAPSRFWPIDPGTSHDTSFIFANGDFEMWMKLCSEKNRQLVRVYRIRLAPTSNDTNPELVAEMAAVYYADDGSTPPAYQYPTTAPVWDQNKNVRTGVTADNYFPTCMDPTPFGSGVSDQAFADMIAKVKMPLCDSAFLQRKDLLMWDRYVPPVGAQVDAMREWSLRGAINAGMSVFSYLEANNLSLHPLPPYYNECQLLP